MKIRTIWALGIALVLAATLSYGQQVVKVNIDFPFTVVGKAMPAGMYELALDPAGTVFTVRGEGKAGALAPVLTRITKELRSNPGEPRVVFDKVGDNYLLSEIWLANEDGYVLLVTKGKHEHKVMGGI